MALSLNCSCGARFDVEDTYAGQTVACPECQASLEAPSLEKTPLRTSGLALASVILALVGAFTVVFTLLAVLLGVCALFSIARNKDRLAGSAYATSGIVAGMAFTVLSLFLYSNLELLPIDGYLEAGLYSSMVDYSGEREVKRKDKGFAITRPSAKWGVAKTAMLDQLGVTCDLMLANPHGRGYVQINTEPVFGRGLDEFVDGLIQFYRNENREIRVGIWRPTMGGFKLRERRPMKAVVGMQVVELVFDMHLGGQELTYLDHVVLAAGHDEFYLVQGWTARRRFALMEEELRRALDSFRVLP
jgi:hypothetical protein